MGKSKHILYSFILIKVLSVLLVLAFAQISHGSFLSKLKSSWDSSEEIDLKWPKVCEFKGTRITSHINRKDFLFERSNILLVDIMVGGGLSLFDLTSCKLKKLKIHKEASQVLPSGKALIKDYMHSISPKKDGQKYRYYISDENGVIDEIIPPSNYWQNSSDYPILSTDGKWVMWLIDKGKVDKRNVRTGHVAKNIETGEIREIDISYISKYPKVVSFNLERDNDITVLSRNPTSVSIRSIKDKSIKWGVTGINNTSYGYYKIYRDFPSSIVHWKWEADTYLNDDEKQAYIEWDLPLGKGRHVVGGGLLISHIAADPGGKYIAVVIERNSRIRSYKGEIFIVRTSDGKKIFSKIFRERFGNQLSVGFGKDYFAYSYFDENDKNNPKSRGSYILRVFRKPN